MIESHGQDDHAVCVDRTKIGELAVAIWRIQRRALRFAPTPEQVTMACDTAIEALGAMGVRFDEMVGQPYHENMRVRVVEQTGEANLRIRDCLAPAVYIDDMLCRPAEVVVVGDSNPL